MRLPKINLRRVSLNFPSGSHAMTNSDNPNQPSKAEKINSQKVRMFTVKNGTLQFFVFSFWEERVAEQTNF